MIQSVLNFKYQNIIQINLFKTNNKIIPWSDYQKIMSEVEYIVS